MTGSGDHDRLKKGRIGCGIFLPIEQKIAPGTAFLVRFIDHDLQGLHGCHKYEPFKIGPDQVPIRIKIPCILKIDRIPKVGVPNAHRCRQVMGDVFCLTVNTGIDREVGPAGNQSIRGAHDDPALAPVDGIKDSIIPSFPARD